MDEPRASPPPNRDEEAFWTYVRRLGPHYRLWARTFLFVGIMSFVGGIILAVASDQSPPNFLPSLAMLIGLSFLAFQRFIRAISGGAMILQRLGIAPPYGAGQSLPHVDEIPSQ